MCVCVCVFVCSCVYSVLVCLYVNFLLCCYGMHFVSDIFLHSVVILSSRIPPLRRLQLLCLLGTKLTEQTNVRCLD